MYRKVVIDLKKKKKKTLKYKIRFFLAFVVFGSITTILGYNLVNNILIIKDMNLRKVELKNQIVELGREKEILENDILKLENPDYIAKYVREKYFYSKDGELILRIDD